MAVASGTTLNTCRLCAHIMYFTQRSHIDHAFGKIGGSVPRSNGESGPFFWGLCWKYSCILPRHRQVSTGYSYFPFLNMLMLISRRSPVFMQKMLRNLGPILFMARNVRQFHGYPLRQAKYSTLNLKIVLEESLRGFILANAPRFLILNSWSDCSGATLSTCPRNVLISTFLLDNHKEGGKR